MKKGIISKIILGGLLVALPIGAGVAVYNFVKKPPTPPATVTKGEFINMDTGFFVGEDVDLNGMKVKITMSDGTSLEFTVDASMVTMPDMSTPGVKTVVINYNGVKYSFDIVVQNKLSDDIAKFLQDYKNNGAKNLKISAVANFVGKYLNEQGTLKEELFSGELSKQDALQADKIVDALYTILTDSVISTSLNIDFSQIISDTGFKAKLDVLKVLTKASDKISKYDYVTYFLEKITPEGTTDYADFMATTTIEGFYLKPAAYNQLKTLYTNLFADLRAYDFNGKEYVVAFNDIVQEHYNNVEIKNFCTSAVEVVNDLEAGDKNAISTFLREYLNINPTMVAYVYPMYNNFTQTEWEQAEKFEQDYANIFVEVVTALENVIDDPSVKNVKILEIWLYSISTIMQNPDVPTNSYIDVLIDGETAKVLVEYLNKYSGDIVLDVIKEIVELSGIRAGVENILPQGTSNSIDFMINTFRNEVLKGEGFTKETYRQFIINIAKDLGFEEESDTQTDINEFITQIDNNGYCNIYSEMFEKFRDDFVAEYMDPQYTAMSEADANAMFDALKSYYKAKEKLPVGIDVGEVMYHLNDYCSKYLDAMESAPNANLSQEEEILLPFILMLTKTTIDNSGSEPVYNYNWESNIYEVVKNINDTITSLKQEELDRLEQEGFSAEDLQEYKNMCIKEFNIVEQLTKTDYDAVNDIYSFDYTQNIVDAVNAFNEYVTYFKGIYKKEGEEIKYSELKAGKYYEVVNNVFTETSADAIYGAYITMYSDNWEVYYLNGKNYIYVLVDGKFYEKDNYIHEYVYDKDLLLLEALTEISTVDRSKNGFEQLNLENNIIKVCETLNKLADDEYKRYLNNVFIGDNGTREFIYKMLDNITTTKDGKYTFEDNLELSRVDVLNFLLNNKEDVSVFLAASLGIDTSNIVAFTKVKLYVENTLTDLKTNSLNAENAVKELFELVDNYSTLEEVKTIASAIAVVGSVYLGATSGDDIDFNEMFKDIPLPEGITVDYNKLIQKLQDNKTYDIFEVRGIEVNYIKDDKGNLIKEVLTFTVGVNLEAAIPATEGFNDFVVAALNGDIVLALELDLV